ncbi:type II secretion system F family protein [Methylomonas sp. SURF-2]|uniref:Type II secretion system F family protein n=1 Tax=Methylomonas subterranea TaxID=2952225 RepID=A0ABT1TI01_9GAMM|nr:type II secretion system F family protein [Methylomonas sp. SURF-2]MCQ8105082.1 type II secretion system F family protein [Methylomonas sp. SURF-2]
MPLFTYKARNADGKLIGGSLEAETTKMVAQNLIGRGLTPISIAAATRQDGSLQQFLHWRAVQQLGINDLILFSRQMYSLTKAGVPMARAINSLAESCRNIAMKQALFGISRKLESGQQLSQAMSQYREIFPVLLISIVNVGETTGGLEQAFQQISHYLEREKETQSRIKSALRYPSMVLVAISVAMVIVNIYVIPAFKGVFDKMGAQLPWQTRLLMSISDFSVSYWPTMLGGLLVLALLIGKYLETADGRRQWHKALLKIPVVGSILERATMERFSRSFAMILDAGVPLIQGISIVAQAVGNDFIGSRLHKMQVGIERGDSISRMARSIGLFPPLVIQMILVGEESGNIAEMLREVADFYEGEIDVELKNLSSAIEPFLIVVIGIMVLGLALGIFLPMWDLSTNMQR